MAFVHLLFSFRFLNPFLDFNKLDVGFKQARCRMSNFYKWDVGFLQVGCRVSDFNKSDVGFLQVGCRILTSRMSEFYKSDFECWIFKVGCWMAPISFRTDSTCGDKSWQRQALMMHSKRKIPDS